MPMKTKNALLLTIGLAAALSACGPSKNDPLEKYKGLNLSSEAQSAPEKVVYKYQDKPVKGDKEIVYVPIYVEKAVEKQVAVYINNCPQADAQKDSDLFKKCQERLMAKTKLISIDGAVYEIKSYEDPAFSKEASLIFKEDEEKTYYIQAKILYKTDIQFHLLTQGLPKEAKIETLAEETNKVQLKITWKPSLNAVPDGAPAAQDSLSVTLTDIQYVDADADNNYIMKLTMDAYSKTKDLDITVLSSESTKLTPEDPKNPKDQTVQKDQKVQVDQTTKKVQKTQTTKKANKKKSSGNGGKT